MATQSLVKIIPGETTCKGKAIFPMMKYAVVFALISLALFLMSLYMIFASPINLGIDFIGGSKMVYELPPETKMEDVRVMLEGLGVGEVPVIPFNQMEHKNQIMLRAKNIPGKDVSKIIEDSMTKTYGGKAQLLSQEVVGPKVGQDLRNKAFLSIIITCGLILVYTGIRFDFLFAPGAVIALVHDVLISFGVYVFFGKEVSLPILAALLTILGYSVNDTIVVYDRIRENINRLPKNISASRIVDISITETFSRSIVTHVTVLLVLLVLFYIGGGVLHDFAFCMMAGVIFGTYSSIFVASPIYIWLQKIFPDKGIKKSV
jgi:preprotein translocase subunit SecF